MIMKTISLGSLLTAMLLLQGCASVKSDISYRKGTDKLWEGDIDQAIVFLQEAIELDPTVARNHYHMALAYQKLGNTRQAWTHIRHAYVLDTTSHQQLQVFMRVYQQLSEQHHLERKHPSAAEVVELLGVGDKYLHDERGDLKAIYYGPLCLRFDQGNLAASDWYSLREPGTNIR